MLMMTNEVMFSNYFGFLETHDICKTIMELNKRKVLIEKSKRVEFISEILLGTILWL